MNPQIDRRSFLLTSAAAGCANYSPMIRFLPKQKNQRTGLMPKSGSDGLSAGPCFEYPHLSERLSSIGTSAMASASVAASAIVR